MFAVGFVLVLTGMIWVGHWMHKRETGAKEGFLELPAELREGAVAKSDGVKPQMNTDERG